MFSPLEAYARAMWVIRHEYRHHRLTAMQLMNLTRMIEVWYQPIIPTLDRYDTTLYYAYLLGLWFPPTSGHDNAIPHP